MPITGSANSAASGDLSVGAPSGSAPGTVDVVATSANADTSITDNNGATPFTKSLAETFIPTGGGGTIALFSRRMQSGDPGTFNFANADGGRNTAVALALDNPDPSTIFDVAPFTDQSASGTTPNNAGFSSMNTLTADAYHVIGIMSDAVGPTIGTPPAGYTLIGKNSVGVGQGCAMAYKQIASPGATGALSWQLQDNADWFSFQFALKVAAGNSPKRFALSRF